MKPSNVDCFRIFDHKMSHLFGNATRYHSVKSKYLNSDGQFSCTISRHLRRKKSNRAMRKMPRNLVKLWYFTQ